MARGEDARVQATQPATADGLLHRTAPQTDGTQLRQRHHSELRGSQLTHPRPGGWAGYFIYEMYFPAHPVNLAGRALWIYGRLCRFSVRVDSALTPAVAP